MDTNKSAFNLLKPYAAGNSSALLMEQEAARILKNGELIVLEEKLDQFGDLPLSIRLILRVIETLIQGTCKHIVVCSK